MIAPSLSPRLLRLASFWCRLQAGMRRRDAPARQAARQRAAFYQSIWQEAAEGLGARMEPLDDDIYEIVLGDHRTKVRCNHTAMDDPMTLALAGNKTAVYRLLRQSGLPIPRHVEFSLDRLGIAREFLKQMAGPCVVKPAKDTGAGDGITTGITDGRHLAWAAAAAAAWCPELILEEQVSGDNYRLLYLDGVLLDAVLRHPPSVAGDGRSTIRELVSQTNAKRLACGFAAAQVLLTFDAEMRRTLARQGLSLRSIPPLGAKVMVKTVINENAAFENEAVTDRLCRPIVEAGARAAQVIGARLAGVDIITRDPSLPLPKTGGVILEVNTTPGFYYHYHRQGAACPVALHVLQSLSNPSGTHPTNPHH